MGEAKTILGMIETVSPDDTAKLDEIDARVWCWLKKDDQFKQFEGSWIRCQSGAKYLKPIGSSEYTRSRDALKAIRPRNCFINIEPRFFCHSHDANFDGMGFYATAVIPKGEVEQEGFHNFKAALIETEELAELHAIIQAIEWERTHA